VYRVVVVSDGVTKGIEDSIELSSACRFADFSHTQASGYEVLFLFWVSDSSKVHIGHFDVFCAFLLMFLWQHCPDYQHDEHQCRQDG
jgi:hypothetical protein